jgi:transcriptional regulator GlxA family with amidase domain
MCRSCHWWRTPPRATIGRMQIDIIIFDGFDELDALGPYEVLRTAETLGADLHAELVGARGAGTITASFGTRLTVDRGPSETADLVLVPGGGWLNPGPGARVEAERGDLPALLARAHERGAAVGSVCTGAMLLAAAGLVQGRPATTHHTAIEDLRAAGATIVDGARVVDDGDVITAGGVTSGLDLALWLVEREAGVDIAEQVARDKEYERRGIEATRRQARAG